MVTYETFIEDKTDEKITLCKNDLCFNTELFLRFTLYENTHLFYF